MGQQDKAPADFGDTSRERLNNLAKETVANYPGTLTSMEKTTIELLAVAWNAFVKMSHEYEEDQKDVRYHIDAIQNIILSRAALRANPDIARTKPRW